MTAPTEDKMNKSLDRMEELMKEMLEVLKEEKTKGKNK